jgi:hypothetical protein
MEKSDRDFERYRYKQAARSSLLSFFGYNGSGAWKAQVRFQPQEMKKE